MKREHVYTKKHRPCKLCEHAITSCHTRSHGHLISRCSSSPMSCLANVHLLLHASHVHQGTNGNFDSTSPQMKRTVKENHNIWNILITCAHKIFQWIYALERTASLHNHGTAGDTLGCKVLLPLPTVDSQFQPRSLRDLCKAL